MSTVQNVGLGSPIVTYPEPRQIQGQPPASTREESPRASTADQVRLQAQEARDANRARAEEDKVEVKEAAKYASKVGLVDGTLDAFVDIVDSRFQRKIARIFGPSEAPAPTAEVPPAAVSKAYGPAAETASGNLRQSA